MRPSVSSIQQRIKNEMNKTQQDAEQMALVAIKTFDLVKKQNCEREALNLDQASETCRCILEMIEDMHKEKTNENR